MRLQFQDADSLAVHTESLHEVKKIKWKNSHKIKKGLLKDNFKDRGVEQISVKQNRKWEHAADETVRGEQLAPGATTKAICSTESQVLGSVTGITEG